MCSIHQIKREESKEVVIKAFSSTCEDLIEFCSRSADSFCESF